MAAGTTRAFATAERSSVADAPAAACLRRSRRAPREADAARWRDPRSSTRQSGSPRDWSRGTLDEKHVGVAVTVTQCCQIIFRSRPPGRFVDHGKLPATTETAFAFGAQVRKPVPSDRTVAPMALFLLTRLKSTAICAPGSLRGSRCSQIVLG